jgi:hypothetical protein
LRRVLGRGEPDPLEFQKYDIELSPGMFVQRSWSGVNAPVFGPDGGVVLIAGCGEDVTDRLNRFISTLEADTDDDGPE